MAMIKFINFKKQYDSQLVLDIPLLEIPQGVYWLKGINGSGKSTLLRSLSGLIPFEGEINIDGINIQKYKRQHRQMVNYGEAAPIYPSFLTGYDLINFYVETKKGDKTECLKHCTALHLSEEMLQKEVGAYSSGMLKKLSLVLAFVGQPKWILLDEPLITLDVEAVQTMLKIIEEKLIKNVGFILTSHQDMDFPDHKLALKTYLVNNKTVQSIA